MQLKIQFKILVFLILILNLPLLAYSNLVYTAKTLDWDIRLIGNLDVAGHETGVVDDLESVLSLDNTIKSFQNIKSVRFNSQEPHDYEVFDESVKINWMQVKPPKAISFSFDITAQTYFNFFSFLDAGNSNDMNSEYLSLTAPLNVNVNLRNEALKLKSDQEMKTLYNVLFYLDKNIALTNDPQIYGPIDTYQKRSGNLISVINLAMSMLRVNDISCRYVSGLVFGEDNLVDSHSWIEVYIGGLGFIPVDLLYKQVGYLDLGHLKLYDYYMYNDKIISHSAVEEGLVNIQSENLKLDAKITGYDGVREEKVYISSELLHDEIKSNSYNILSLNIENNNPYPVIIYLDLDDDQMFEIEDSKRYVFISGQTTIVENFLFTQKIPSNQDKIELEVKETNPRLKVIRELISEKYNVSRNGKFLSKSEGEKLIADDVNIIKNEPTPEKIFEALKEDLEVEEIEIIIDKHEDIKEVVKIQKISVFDNETNKTTVYLNITPEDKAKLANVSIYESIPKCLAEEIGMENFNDDFVEIINTDPLIVWNFGNLDASQIVSYEVITKLRDTDCEDESLTIAIADSIIKDLKTMSTFKVYLIVLGFVSFIFIVYVVIRPGD